MGAPGPLPERRQLQFLLAKLTPGKTAWTWYRDDPPVFNVRGQQIAAVRLATRRSVQFRRDYLVAYVGTDRFRRMVPPDSLSSPDIKSHFHTGSRRTARPRTLRVPSWA